MLSVIAYHGRKGKGKKMYYFLKTVVGGGEEECNQSKGHALYEQLNKIYYLTFIKWILLPLIPIPYVTWFKHAIVLLQQRGFSELEIILLIEK